MSKKPSLREIRKMQSVPTEPKKKTKKVSQEKLKVMSDEVVGLDKGRRTSPRINVTIQRNTYDALHTEMEIQKDNGLKGSMSAFIDEAIREKLKLDS